MKIHAGIDLVDIDRIKKSLENNTDGFLNRICVPSELEWVHSSRRRDEKVAAIFALKEAFSKALGTGIGVDLSFHDLEVSYSERGQPLVRYLGQRFQYLSSDWSVSCSVSHEGRNLVALVVIAGNLT
jgi:holo-[acyl-carrier protein] synthase